MFVAYGIRTHTEAKNSADGTLRTRCARCACSESQLGAVARFGPLKGVGQPTATEHQHHTQHTHKHTRDAHEDATTRRHRKRACALRSVRLFRVTAWRCGSVRTPLRGGPADRHRTPTHTTHHRPQATKPSVHIPICFVVSFMCRRRFEGGPEERACARWLLTWNLLEQCVIWTRNLVCHSQRSTS